ncbi:murein hydrolase activator EnvC family protein [Pseudorhodoplanes sp.]|uniref:murein hydrolase activator EnvC family protein n=1 Tax=Pseudorhodoplanes sp. TaxID=1934341 RepID=UPI003D106905
MNHIRTQTMAFRPLLAGTALFAAATFGSPAGLAQTGPAKPALKGAVDNDILKARERELEAIRAEQKRATENEARLRGEIEAFGKDRRKLNSDLIGTAARLREVEARLSATEGRVAPLEERERGLRRSLNDRRETIADILAALQRMGRRPPPALLVSPQDAASALRSAIMLGAVVPELRQRAEQLAADLSALETLRTELASERTRLSADAKALSEEQQRMTLLIEERQKQQAETEKALEREREQATALARQADSLKDLVARLELGLDSAARAARSAPAADHKGATRQALAALSDPGRMSPAIAFASARGSLPMPVNGVKIRDFGAADGIGGTERGISVATRPGAQVTAPCDGWVVYAGPFRSYGQLLILNAGGGYHVVLAGMERISVDIGQFVLTGEPVAVMGSGTAQVAAAVSAGTGQVGTSQPVLYVEFRKDGTPVDSGPWWAKKESEKVRG